MRKRTDYFVGASIVAFAAAGCASTAPYANAPSDPYAAALYTGAPQPDVGDLYAGLYAPAQTSSNGAPLELVSYAGIEGARRAHQLYSKAEAEALDGRCEASVRPNASESMIDIAELCDVPLQMLVEFNPGVADISYSTDGARVRIPGGLESPQGAFAMSDQLVLLDAVQPGDTLEKIAYRLNVSETSLANLNPGVDWTNPKVGQAFVKPAAAAAVTGAPAHEASEPAPAWQGYSGLAASGGTVAGGGGATPHAPYQLTPVKAYARAAGVYPDDRLEVDREFVKAGGKVEVTARAEPGASVTFYSGESPGAMTKSKTVRANENGRATAVISVKKKSNMGGVVFGARQQGSSETQYSERVGVIQLEENGAPGAGSEGSDEE